MIARRALTFGLAVGGLLCSPSPALAQTRCVSTAEAEALTLVTLPAIIRQTGTMCSARVPAASLLRQTRGAFIARYDEAADRAWPTARSAITKLTDPMIQGMLDSAYARPLLGTLVAPLLVGQIKPQDCGTIDRLVTQLAPLPPRNTASVIVTAVQFLQAEKARGAAVTVPDLPLCPAPK